MDMLLHRICTSSVNAVQIYYIKCEVRNIKLKIMGKKIDDVSARFLKELDAKRISGYMLRRDGVMGSQSSLTAIRNGVQGVSRKVIDACADLYGLDKVYILLGDEAIRVSNNSGNQMVVNALGATVTNSNNKNTEQAAKPVKLYLRENLVNVPLIQQDAAASFIDNFGDMQYSDSDTYGVMMENGEDLASGKYVVFQVKGDSMTPTIPDEAKVLAQMIEQNRWEDAYGVVFVAYGKSLTVKRVLKNSLYLGNALTLKADNPIYGQLDISRNEIRGIWKAERIVSQKIK